MRLADTFENEERARRICDYLLSQGIDTTLRATGESFGVWIIEEADLESAAAILREFREDPAAEKFQRGAREASAIRQLRRRATEAQQKQEVQVRRRWTPPTLADIPVTAGLVLVCVALALMTDFGRDQTALSAFWFTGAHWEQVKQGQVWRIFAPALIHFGLLHLLFNMMFLFRLGGIIEHRRGTLRYVGLLLLFEFCSSMAQVVWDPITPSGGMSGAVYGLIGYAWMKSKFEPRLGVHIEPGLVAFSMFWFFLCMLREDIANAAHAGGLAVGIVVGRIPTRRSDWVQR